MWDCQCENGRDAEMAGWRDGDDMLYDGVAGLGDGSGDWSWNWDWDCLG